MLTRAPFNHHCRGVRGRKSSLILVLMSAVGFLSYSDVVNANPFIRTIAKSGRTAGSVRCYYFNSVAGPTPLACPTASHHLKDLRFGDFNGFGLDQVNVRLSFSLVGAVKLTSRFQLTISLPI